MSRTYRVGTETREATVTHVSKKCDKCGKNLTDDWQDTDAVAQEITVFLNPEECVSYRRRRDYCPPCSVIIWHAINKIIEADPQAEYDPDIDEWYG